MNVPEVVKSLQGGLVVNETEPPVAFYARFKRQNPMSAGGVPSATERVVTFVRVDALPADVKRQVEAYVAMIAAGVLWHQRRS